MSLNEKYLSESFKKLIQDDNYYYLYKHIAIDPEMLVFGVFSNNQLKYNFPAFFNDPFDCLFDIQVNVNGFNKEEFEKIVDNKVPVQFWNQQKKLILNKLNDPKLIAKHLYKLRKEMLTITCFNSNPLSILMWSHYADHHKGILLEFKIPKIDSKLFPIPVFYGDEYQTINAPWQILANIDRNQEFILDITRETIFRKSTEWSYEKEFRLIGDLSSNPDSPLLQPYPPEYLSSVIMGASLTDHVVVKKLKNEVKSFNKNNSLKIKIFKAQLKKGQYLLEVPNHPRLR